MPISSTIRLQFQNIRDIPTRAAEKVKDPQITHTSNAISCKFASLSLIGGKIRILLNLITLLFLIIMHVPVDRVPTLVIPQHAVVIRVLDIRLSITNNTHETLVGLRVEDVMPINIKSSSKMTA